MTLFLGDSLTRGTVGFSYIRFMKEREHRNKGRNGDPVYGALKRLVRYRQRPWYERVDACVVLLGTNDLLRPFLCSSSRGFRVMFRRKVERTRCADAREVFEAYYRDIVMRLCGDGKRVILVGIPKLQLDGFPQEKLREYNSVIRGIATEVSADFVDTSELQSKVFPRSREDFVWGQTCVPRGLDILIMGLLPFTKEMFSRLRRLELTVDGIHSNKFTARTLAKELDAVLDRMEELK